MFLQIHPTRSEALTASETTLTRWSLTTNPATILTQISTAPGTVFDIVIDPGGRVLTFGGIARTPDGEFFALQQPQTRFPSAQDSCVIEWRRWNDLLPMRSVSIPHTCGNVSSMESSPDGRWLVFDDGGTLILLDWQTGQVSSLHFSGGYAISGLAFDPTSTFVAGLSFSDGGGCLQLWQLDPAEHVVPRPMREDWISRSLVPQDQVYGTMALTLTHEKLDRTSLTWPDRDLADTESHTTFSQDSHSVVFSLKSSYSECGMELVMYEVPSGRRLWCARSEQESSGACAFTPDGHLLLVPAQENELLAYRAQDGTLLQRLQSGYDEPVQALAFDHDGSTLWLAGETTLWQYQTQS